MKVMSYISVAGRGRKVSTRMERGRRWVVYEHRSAYRRLGSGGEPGFDKSSDSK